MDIIRLKVSLQFRSSCSQNNATSYSRVPLWGILNYAMRGRFSSTIFSTYYYLMSICQKSMVFIALPLPATLMAPTYQNQMQRLSCNFFSNHQWWWHKNCCCFEQKLPATQDFQGCLVEVKFHCPGMGACCCTFISVVCVLYCSQ